MTVTGWEHLECYYACHDRSRRPLPSGYRELSSSADRALVKSLHTKTPLEDPVAKRKRKLDEREAALDARETELEEREGAELDLERWERALDKRARLLYKREKAMDKLERA